MDGKITGLRLKRLREKLGLTQSDVQKITGIHQVTISYHENGDSIPGSEKILKYADCYKTTTDYILGRTDDPEPPLKHNEPPGLAYFFERITEFLSPAELPLTADERQALRGIPGHLTPRGYAHVIRTVRMVAEKDNPNTETDNPKQ